MGKFIDLTGQKFGRLTVIARAENDKDNRAQFNCVCDCGKELVVRGKSLKTGNTSSCGCLHSEQLANRNVSSAKHHLRNHRLYKIWSSMKNRCYNPKATNYNDYGGRGINICDEWKNDFKAFYNWAMENGYDENAGRGECSIDRVENDKGYEPSNCRWTNSQKQTENRRNMNKVVINGIRYTSMVDAAKALNVTAAQIRYRLKKEAKKK